MLNTSKSSRLYPPYVVLLAQVVFTLLIVAAGTVVLFPFRDAILPSLVALLFLLPVAVCTVFFGLGPGIISALLAFMALNYFFTKPYNTFRVFHPQDLLMLVIFLFVAVVMSQLVGRVRASLSEARDRERETVWLYELSTTLASLNDPATIARRLAEQALSVFQADCIQVSVDSSITGKQMSLRVPPGDACGEQKPVVIVPMEIARGFLGEICLWRAGRSLSVAEERLLNAFAGQGALALERARLGLAVNKAEVLEESDKLKSALLSSVSHELRSPLATIKASVSTLREDDQIDPAARQELLAAIEEETDHLNYLVGNLLDMSRIEAGVLKPDRRWNVLSEIVASALARLVKQRENHKIEVDIPEDLPMLPVDYVQMERVFLNLVSNSLKYSPDGTTICLQVRSQGDQEVLVMITNQGPQVPEDHLDRIFDKFHRITAAERVTGTGLGLSICKGFVEAHGGKIWAQNLPDGFAFYFTIPMTWEGGRPNMPVEQ